MPAPDRRGYGGRARRRAATSEVVLGTAEASSAQVVADRFVTVRAAGRPAVARRGIL